MCGIAGVFSLSGQAHSSFSKISDALQCIAHRGPDSEGIYTDRRCTLGHRRLSIIDTGSGGHQPFSDPEGNYFLVFNGEFFNYREERENLQRMGITFRTESDTEVLLHGLMKEGVSFLKKVNGFFAFAFYNRRAETLLLARDRFGVKPLYTYEDGQILYFASEIKSILALTKRPALSKPALKPYFHLNYFPGSDTPFVNLLRFEPGTGSTYPEKKTETYYTLQIKKEKNGQTSDVQATLRNLLSDAVRIRMRSDVPLGSFLSGGIDSSIVTALAARETPNIHSFSIGFPDEPHFDETRYARQLAQKYGTRHTVFEIRNKDLLEVVNEVLDSFDEPFADSSALNVYLLSRETRKHVTVALSGDGADEVFGGYNKHYAEWNIRNRAIMRHAFSVSAPLWQMLPKSRQSHFGNRIRQFHKLSVLTRKPAMLRYWISAGYLKSGDPSGLFLNPSEWNAAGTWEKQIGGWLRHLQGPSADSSMNAYFLQDAETVLRNDMLVKVDLMSMAHSLEVRNPFLDYRVVDFAFGLPDSYKTGKRGRKLILLDTFRDLFPPEILNRSKQGFEVPLLGWFRKDLKPLIEENYLADSFIRSQNLFNPAAIVELKKRLNSNNPDDAVARVWGLIVFQHWWIKHFQNG